MTPSVLKYFSYLDKPNGELRVEHEDGFVVPRVLAVEVDAVKDVLDEGVGDDREQHGVLEAEDQLKIVKEISE